ncbi:MAG: ABC transporter permease, partial [Bacillota bacterium]|nr:ABC transporter permease [Bacillota bacterium]
SIILSTGFLSIIALILVFAACLGIVNAFTANLEERRRQIGLLRAVGATRKQIRGIFGREALILAGISVPLGVLLACLTVWGMTGLLGENYTFAPNLFIITGVAVFGTLCVMLAAAIPLRNASAIPPMQAIRDAALSRKMKKHSVKSAQHFDVPRLLAHRNLTLYKSKRLGVTAMLAVSIILMSLISFVAGPLMSITARNWYTSDFEICKSGSSQWLMEEDFHAPGITEQDRTDAAALSGVARVDGQKTFRLKILVDKLTPYLTADDYGHDFQYLMRKAPKDVMGEPDEPWMKDEDWTKDNDVYLASKEKYHYLSDYLTVDCGGMDERTINMLSDYVSEGSIDPKKLATGEEILIVAPSEYGFRKEGDREYTDLIIDPQKEYVFTAKNDSFHAGDKITLSLLYTDGKLSYDEASWVLLLPDKTERMDRTVTIGAVIDPALDKENKMVSSIGWLFFFENFSIVTTHTGLAALGFDVPYESLSIYLSGSPDTGQEEYLIQNLENIAAKTPTAELHPYVAQARETRETVLRVLIVGAAVIILFFAICVSMVNNSISARIRASKREIGTLRAVGASQADVTRSYLWQLLSMFTWGTAIGIAAELAICIWLIDYLGPAAQNTLTLPIWQPMVFAIILFLLCFVNIRNKVIEITKGSIVENIREL